MDKLKPADATKQLPRLDLKTGINHSPHVVILGAGASRACLPQGDKNGKKLPVMNDFIETLNLRKTIEALGHNPTENFETLYSAIHASKNESAVRELDVATRHYFESLELPITPTLYDYLVLSLRPKDMIISFNWDPLLPQAFQRWRKLGAVLPELVFLHGNTDVGVNIEKKSYGFLSDKGAKIQLSPTPLLYPVLQKDYASDPFIANQWDLATSTLAEAYFVTIFGYSAPRTDVQARSLLQNAWLSNPTRYLAQIDIIDIQDRETLEKNWFEFIVKEQSVSIRTDIVGSYLFNYPRRSCEAIAFATLQQKPWHDNPFPPCRTLAELENWTNRLIVEEARGKLADKGCG